ncbi:SseB family protein [Streptomyces roseirectus]|uniref:SseB family protein n=1 Tax=Streptomyces roseirectus TaxID=2768066 RepID=A0A7H0IRH4_9ACTN|nr:SseB family protein [Streptomyces roseirectus]QNP75390.1 SseB family protein [Streptomyces roseirectus]
MTDQFPNGADSAVRLALRALITGDADQAELRTLAAGEILIPVGDVPEEQPPVTVSVPVYEQPDGTELVPVFTSQDRLRQAFPQVTRHRQILLGALAHEWPAEGPMLVIDAGTVDEVTLTAHGVRELLDQTP